MFDLRELFRIGETCEINKVVEVDDTVGNKSIHLNQLLSTSSCVETFITACNTITDKALPEGFITIGHSVEITHVAPTLLGSSITYKATLREISANKLIFHLEAWDGVGEVLYGNFERAVVNHMALMDKAVERANRLKEFK